MKTSLETLGGLKRSLTVSLPIDTFKQKVDKVLRKMASSVTIDGFRKGKAPTILLRQRFGESANADATNEIVNETLADALAEVKATPVDRPSITKIDSKGETNFSYTIAFEVYPDIQVGDFSKLAIEQAKVKITQADEEKTLAGLIEQATEYKIVQRKSKLGDQLTIDFKGTMNGEEFAGSSAKDFKIVLGKGAMIEGFEAGLIDVAANKTTTLDLQFPQDYHAKQLAGNQAIFEVIVKEVAEPQAPELDEKFAERFGEKNMEALKIGMKEQMHTEADNRLANQNKDAIFEVLLVTNDFEVPQVSIDNEAQNLLKEMQARMQQEGITSQGEQLPAATFNKEAERRVKLGLLIAQVASDNKFTASKQQLDEKLLEMSQAYGENAQQMVDYYNADPTRLSSIELLVVEKMVEDEILSKAKVVFKEKKFQEVTQNIPAPK